MTNIFIYCPSCDALTHRQHIEFDDNGQLKPSECICRNVS